MPMQSSLASAEKITFMRIHIDEQSKEVRVNERIGFEKEREKKRNQFDQVSLGERIALYFVRLRKKYMNDREIIDQN